MIKKTIFFLDPEGNVNASIVRCISCRILVLLVRVSHYMVCANQPSTDIFAVVDHHDMLHWDVKCVRRRYKSHAFFICYYLEIPCLSPKKVHLCLKV